MVLVSVSRTNTSSRLLLSPLTKLLREANRATHQVGGKGAKRHNITVAADGRGVAQAIARRSRSLIRNKGGGSQHPIVDKHIVGTVGVSGHQIGGSGTKRDIAPVRADTRVVAVSAHRLRPTRRHRDARCDARRAVMHKDIGDTIGISHDKIGRHGAKGHKLPVGAELRARKKITSRFI